MEKFFSVFGKVILVLLILGGAAGAAFYYGRQTTPTPQPNTTEVAVETPLPTDAPQASASSRTITAGLDASSGLSFMPYTLQLPEGWLDAHEQSITPTDILTLTKDAYSIEISQVGAGGSMCLYPGDAPFEGPAATYDTYTPFVSGDNVSIRRSGTMQANGQTRTFTLCQAGPDNSFQQPTQYGYIRYTTPLVPDAQMLQEMDSIMASLKKS